MENIIKESHEPGSANTQPKIEPLALLQDINAIKSSAAGGVPASLPEMDLLGISNQNCFSGVVDTAKSLAHKGEDVLHKGKEIAINVWTTGSDLIKVGKESLPQLKDLAVDAVHKLFH